MGGTRRGHTGVCGTPGYPPAHLLLQAADTVAVDALASLQRPLGLELGDAQAIQLPLQLWRGPRARWRRVLQR